MTIDERDPKLQALFAQSQAELPAQPFTAQVLDKVNKRRRRGIAWRGLCAVVLALGVVALEGYALQIAHILFVTVVEIESSLLAQVLAPLNTVGGLLSIALLMIRAAHRRLFA
jgi:hypothetical protein